MHPPVPHSPVAPHTVVAEINLYNCLEDGQISLLQSYADEDKKESFYTVSWACGVKENPFVVAGGVKGIIRVINVKDETVHVNDETVHKSLVGHEGSVNEIKTHPMKPQLVLSASKDESVRLWNVETGICILIFAGTGGHRNEVISVELPFSVSLYDFSITLWLPSEFWTYVEDSFTSCTIPCKYFSVFTASSVHTNYVDCNRWFGDFILSKSVENEILLWEPILKDNPGEGTSVVLVRYPIPNCNLWFIKFSCDLFLNYLTIGNDQKAIVYTILLEFCEKFVKQSWLSHDQSKSVIRQTAMSTDGNTILAASEDGTIWRWDAINKEKPDTVGERERAN
ncbi:unnamed protein product [Eruca vesicaria subsp. sativa]|uniref:Uncharacterized protein n=1 Tax=Eruca vesicaria subsp. sativa TaxID=29727 RepID=A0ABC8JU35_ERUVS|nr:unnamed protein product [Eruca vesicaria subsp. sativa]